MLTVIIRRDADPNTVQLTQKSIMKELWGIDGSELLVTDSWTEGIRKVRTKFFCLLEADATLSSSYLSSNFGLMKKMSLLPKGGGNVRLAMIASCLGIADFGNRIYDYRLDKTTDDHGDVAVATWQPSPDREKRHSKLYEAQIGFVPGAIMRTSSMAEVVDTMEWDNKDLVRLSYDLSVYLWGSNRRLQVNPNTTYVSMRRNLEKPPRFTVTLPDNVRNLFVSEGL